MNKKFSSTTVQFIFFSCSLFLLSSCEWNEGRREQSSWSRKRSSCDPGKKCPPRPRIQRQAVQCPTGGWTGQGEKCYLVAKNQIDQPTAETNCRSGTTGHLVSVETDRENEYIKSLASNIGAQSIWIGLRYEDDDNGWKWLTQVPYNYSHWSNGQPTEPNSKRCVVLNTLNDGNWESRQCYPATADGYVCVTAALSVQADPCQSNPCQNGGSCTIKDGNYSCTCVSGFTGVTCSIPPSFCASNPCQHGGTCTDSGTSFQCSCDHAYTGTRCELPNGPVTIRSGSASGICSVGMCSNGGTCIDTNNGRFLCRCALGFTGERCEFNGQTTMQSGPTSGPCTVGVCLNGGTCIPSINGRFLCRCADGFSGGRCENSAAVATTAMRLCVSSPCLNGGTCIDGVNEFSCKCSSGWSGAICNQQISNCEPNPCKHSGRCYTLSVSEYICKCADGYVGEQCENDVNECDYGPCSKGETCLNTAGSFKCLCPSPGGCSLIPPPLYTTLTVSKGPLYIVKGGCGSGPCRSGGSCFSQAGGGYTCGCVNGYSGSNCEYGNGSPSPTITECDSSQCKNSGSCGRGPSGRYECQCSKGYTGPMCTVPCPTGWSWWNGICYYGENVSSNYEQAVSLCPRHQPGSYLLTVQSQSEFDNAAILMNQLQSNIWLGLKYDVSRARFVWITGDTLDGQTFTAWGPQQPKNVEKKPCVRIAASAGFIWETEDCNRSWKLICKYKG